jgi:hypothetical protein
MGTSIFKAGSVIGGPFFRSIGAAGRDRAEMLDVKICILPGHMQRFIAGAGKKPDAARRRK